MQEVVKRMTHLLNELDNSTFNSKEESAEYLKERGYNPDELGKTIALSVKQTIARLNREHAKEIMSSKLETAMKLFIDRYSSQQSINDPKEYLMATLGRTQPVKAQLFFSNLENLSPEDAISTLNDELLLLLIDELKKPDA
jgi:hypothetical protein